MVKAFNSTQKLTERLRHLMPNPPEIEEPNEEIARENVEEDVTRLSKEMFETDAIVYRITKKLDRVDMRTFRQISRLCYKKSKWLWLRKTWVLFRDNNFANNRPLHEVDNFFEEIISREVPFPEVSLTLSVNELPICTPDVETLDQLSGSQIKSLEFEVSSLKLGLSMTEVVEPHSAMISLLIENAERFHLRLTEGEDNSKDIEAPSVLFTVFSKGLLNLRCLKMTVETSLNFDFLRKFPALEQLVLSSRDNNYIPCDFSNLFTDLYRIRSKMSPGDPEILNLKSLDTIGVPTFSLQNLPLANLSLEHLALALHKDISESQLAPILDQCAPTLKSLKLLKYKIRSHKPFDKIPLTEIFLNLKEVELWGNMVNNLDFLKCTPNIIKLKMDFFCFECRYFSGDVNDGPAVCKDDLVQKTSDLWQEWDFRLSDMQEFATDCILPWESWRTLVTWMPNLRVLEAPIPDNATLLNLCDDLRKLEKLRLRFRSVIDDYGIVGDSIQHPDGSVTYPRGIKNLTDLRSFELEVECGKGKLTHMSAYLGFFKLDHLNSLKLGFTCFELTDEIVGKLSERNIKVEMYRHRCSKSRKEGGKVENCCKWDDFKRAWDPITEGK